MLEPVTDPFDALAEARPAAARGRQRALGLARQRGDVDAALAGVRARGHRDLPDAVHRARVPRAGVVPGRARRTAAAARLLAGPGHLGRPPADRVVPRACREDEVRVTQVSTGGAFGAQGGPERPVARGAARHRHRPAGAADADARGEPALPLEAPPDVARLHGRLRRGRTPAPPSARGSSATPAPMPASATRCSSARPATPAARTRCPTSTSRRRAVYTNNPPCGAMRGFGVNQTNFAIEGVLDLLAEQVGIDGWEIRWRNALDVGDRFGTGQKLGPGRRPQADAARRARRLPRRAVRRHRLRRQEHRHRQRHDGVRPTPILRPEADGTVDPLPLLDGDGPGRPHRARARSPATELGLAPERIHVVVDTERELETGQTTASRATVLGGSAVIDAARKLKAALDGAAARGARRRRSSAASSSSTGRRRSAPTSRSRSRTSRTAGRRRS